MRTRSCEWKGNRPTSVAVVGVSWVGLFRACFGLLLGLDLGPNLDKVRPKIKSNKMGLGLGPDKKIKNTTNN